MRGSNGKLAGAGQREVCAREEETLVLRRVERASYKGRWCAGPAARRVRIPIVRHWVPYSFLAPFFLLFGIFGLFSFVYTFYLSFTYYKGAGSPIFIGIANYTSLLQNSLFLTSLGNTGIIFVITTVPLMVLGLLLAVAVNNRRLRGRAAFRTIFILPFVTSTVIISLIFQSMFAPSYGWINVILGHLGLPPVAWLTSSWGARASIAIVDVWQYLGYDTVLMLGGLLTIPPSIYEAAEIDGAGAFRRLTSVVVPLMRPTLLFVLVLSTIGTMAMFIQPYELTDGGPNYSTLTTTLYLYNSAFKYGEFGYASAMAVVMFMITLVASVLQVRWFKGGRYA